ncbi:MAG TPA: nucleotide sugar dehydrogenase [Flavobacteriales bacterium]|jgi:UDP-N-acetyl-D-galactosamine dehydrogenase|nr:nucleotide sugar dehydrogenase [Flavobacteriales bacterium]
MENQKIAIIGLGYVGLPLAVELGKKYVTTGFDIDTERVNQLNSGHDDTLEVEDHHLQSVLKKHPDNSSQGLYLSCQEEDVKDHDIYIITVPTPVDKYNRPVLTPLIKASESVGRVMKKGSIVVYESTVYPGATEEECIPVLERTSGMKYNEDFYAGYSPERINPGDKVHTVTTIKKVTSGSTPEVATKIDEVYKSVITAGTHLAPSIKVAEAAKVIENAQRDINIAFVNELSKIFNIMEIDTHDVLEAASTKWNFLHFTPGLVGGHCIGVDPYYLAQKSMELGYHPEIILAGRRLNDSMGEYVAGEIVKLMVKKKIQVVGARILMLGITFKENTPDIRNSKAVDIYRELVKYQLAVDVHDPWASKEEVTEEYGFELKTDLNELAEEYDAVVLAVSHKKYLEINITNFLTENSVLYDVKGFFPRDIVDARL